MKKVIANKEHTVVKYCLSITAIGIVAFVVGILLHSTKIFLIGLGPVVLCIIFSIMYSSMPNELIILSDDENSIVLPKNRIITLDSILGVTYKNTNRYKRELKWGSITIMTDVGKHKVLFVEHCAAVQDRINQLVAEAKKC